MTIKELKKLLEKYDENMEVITEGCDCYGTTGKIRIIKANVKGKNTEDVILIERDGDDIAQVFD